MGSPRSTTTPDGEDIETEAFAEVEIFQGLPGEVALWGKGDFREADIAALIKLLSIVRFNQLQGLQATNQSGRIATSMDHQFVAGLKLFIGLREKNGSTFSTDRNDAHAQCIANSALCYGESRQVRFLGNIQL